jgi:hypothetical protein
MLLDQLTESVDLFPAKAVAALQPDRVEPELRLTVVTFDVDVRRFTPIPGVEEEPERAHSEYSRHVGMLHRSSAKCNILHRATRDYAKHKGPVTFRMWQRQPDGSWKGPTELVTEQHPLSRNDNMYSFRPSFVVQPYAPPNFIPLAWTCDRQRWVKVMRVPVDPGRE